jgi:two-component system sensor histidine kinase TctE
VTADHTSTTPHALLQVSDTGPGLAPADRERVFERFVRASDIGQGCGLGLAIVKEIVERHHGKVQLDEVLPHGLCVSIRLPLSPTPAT